MMNKCYKCKWRRAIPGNCHSSCANRNAQAKGDPHGIKRGWFFFPFNFDPVWLIECNGFEEVTENEQS